MQTKTYNFQFSKFFLIAILTILFSCGSDDSTSVDPCANITCLNGGVCVNGECDCPDGYSGPNCGDEITPLKMRISKIKITSFPQYDGNSTWDVTSGPDVYVFLIKGEDLIHEQPTYIENADSSVDYTYVPNNLIELNDVTGEYGIGIADHDSTSSDDVMGGIYFYPYSDGNNFPTTLTLDTGDGISFELTVSYIW